MSIVVMAKAPVAGAAKTRLIPTLGPEGAARLHAALTRHALATAVRAGARVGAATPVVLASAGAADHPFFAELERAHPITLLPQGEGDLGERMQRVFAATLSGGPVVMIGGDCPTLTPADIAAAHVALAAHEAVFVAAEDGGYVLIGLARPCPPLFVGVDWGTADVLAQTLSIASRAGISTSVLATRYDIDRENDYHRMCDEGALPGWVHGA
jgi:uncharacterized protein